MSTVNRLTRLPEDGVGPLVDAIGAARECVELYVFRLDHPEIIAALGEAVARGVAVRTLVTHANGGSDLALRGLELRLLELGATVSRSDNDLLRYHGKLMLVDRAELHILGYNLTRKDIERSRSLAVVTTEQALVTEAMALFDADFDRRAYTPGEAAFVVSPLNSRASLIDLIDGASETLLIYDNRLNDRMLQRVIRRRSLSGVNVRVLGASDRTIPGVDVRPQPGARLHARAIVQDGARVFIGSQSLRRTALDRRREIGVILNDAALATEVGTLFESDWRKTAPASAGDAAVA